MNLNRSVCFIAASVASLLCFAPHIVAAQGACDVEEVGIVVLQQAMAEGRCTSRSITAAYLARIAAIDQDGPRLQSILEVNPHALQIADSLDRERAAGHVRGPLHGIPIVLKDNIASADGMTTTAGALALKGSFAPEDAGLVARLREAGAVLIAKANLSEWANFRVLRSSSGWSGRGGQTKNPYVLDRSPCGSSSGTGAAVAASLAAAGVGTDTDGSIVCPSSVMGLVGIKPTVGLVGRFGVIPIAESQDVAGPMARSVEDAALLLSAMAGPDPRDAATDSSEGHVESDYTAFLDPDGLRGARIGVLRGSDFFGYNTHTDQLAQAAILDMQRAGAVIVDSLDFPTRSVYGEDEFTVLLYEFKHGLNAYLEWLGPEAPVKSLADVIAFNEAHPDPYFGQEILVMAEESGPLTDEKYLAARERTKRITRGALDSLLAVHDLDALVVPTETPAWPIDLVNGDIFQGSSPSPAAVSGYASITVPAGQTFGLPVGITFIGTAWSEPTLLRLAYSFEQLTKHRRPPRYLPTLE